MLKRSTNNKTKYDFTEKIGVQPISDRAKQFFKDYGFLVLENLFSEQKINEFNSYIEELWLNRKKAPPRTTIDVFYQDKPHLFTNFRNAPDDAKSQIYKLNDIFLDNREARNFALDRKLVEILNELIEGYPCICNSLWFERSSTQPAHFDTYYMPPPAGGRLIVSSICFDDHYEDNGPVFYYPKSHKIQPWFNSDGTTTVRNSLEQEEANLYAETKVNEMGLEKYAFLGKKGDVLIWDQQLLHGGSPIVDMTKTRRSLVTHYWRVVELENTLLKTQNGGFYLEKGPKSLQEIPWNFAPEKYLQLNLDVKAASVAPEKHFLSHGFYEGRLYF